MNFLRRTSSRLLSNPACQQRRQSLLLSATRITSTTNHPSILRTVSSVATSTTTIQDLSVPSHLSSFNNNITTRSKHSSTQIKRLFKNNPARRRIALKNINNNPEISNDDDGIIPEANIPTVISDPKIFPNGWNPPLGGGGGDNVQIPNYPFEIARTKNKPNNSVGFLPVYSEFRKDGARITTRIKKVSGDRDIFLNELRATLQIPIPKNPREDTIRIRTGGTIEIKGNRVLEVKTWLAALGF